MIEYKTTYETVADDGTLTISGRVGRTVQVTHMLINGVGTETIDAAIVYNTILGAAIVCAPLTQVTAASGVPSLRKFNDPATQTFPIVINEGESLVLTCDSSAAGDMTFAVTTRIES
jgi:hypothetical protein